MQNEGENWPVRRNSWKAANREEASGRNIKPPASSSQPSISPYPPQASPSPICFIALAAEALYNCRPLSSSSSSSAPHGPYARRSPEPQYLQQLNFQQLNIKFSSCERIDANPIAYTRVPVWPAVKSRGVGVSDLCGKASIRCAFPPPHPTPPLSYISSPPASGHSTSLPPPPLPPSRAENCLPQRCRKKRENPADLWSARCRCRCRYGPPRRPTLHARTHTHANSGGMTYTKRVSD